MQQLLLLLPAQLVKLISLKNLIILVWAMLMLLLMAATEQMDHMKNVHLVETVIIKMEILAKLVQQIVNVLLLTFVILALTQTISLIVLQLLKPVKLALLQIV